MAFTITTVKKELKHEIEYTFLCQSCGKQSGIVKHVFHVDYSYSFRHPNKSYRQDEIALRRIVENKLINVLRDAYLSSRNGEYHFFSSNGETHVFLSNACLHCKNKQEWRGKRKGLFSKEFLEVPPENLPRINWRFEAVKPDMPEYINGYLALLRVDAAEKIPKDEKEKRTTQEKVLRSIDAVTEGLSEHLLKDLMMCEWPLEAEAGSLIRPANAPPLRAGEKAYGYCGADRSWWIIVNNKVVSRVLTP